MSSPETLATDLSVLRDLVQRRGHDFADAWVSRILGEPASRRDHCGRGELAADLVVLTELARRRGGPWLQRWVRMLACSPNATPSPEYRDLSPLDPRD